ncbi:hypothetical protein GMOD_00000549 [Pyrenophora seminiperda CCB06]|uniref:Uncharacterized protein n=1 Tax=Pyrenophora seminiperda CCB06 TaxID=1302712 RepID=A0A3M7M7K0_9PLEO|nr:hypothetical protein GMOD_00000549 [Pyrenophora seminiperda CCB06]
MNGPATVTSNPQLGWGTDKNYADLLAGLVNKTGDDVTWTEGSSSTSDGGFMNGTGFETANVANTPLPNMDGRYAIDVRIGRLPTHVGTFRGKRLYNRIYNMLKDCCIAKHDPSIPGYCEKTRPECKKQCDLENVVYSNGHTTYRSDSVTSLYVHYSYFNDQFYPGIQDLGFQMVAKIYQAMADSDENCFYWDFPGTRRTYICYVASRVEIAFATNGGPIAGVLNVELIWNKKTMPNTWNCEKTQASIDGMMWGNRYRFAEVMRWPKDKILPFTFCTDPPCFQQRLKIEEPWYEGKGCKRLDWPNGCGPNSESYNPGYNCPPVA